MRKLFVPAIATVAVFAGSTVALAGGGSANDAPAKTAAKPKKTITEKVVASKRFDTLESLVVSAGLAETLSGKGPYTVFAPTDKAFSKVPAGDARGARQRPRRAAPRPALPRRRRPLPRRARGPQALDQDARRPAPEGQGDQARRPRRRSSRDHPGHQGLQRRDPRDQPRPDPAAVDPSPIGTMPTPGPRAHGAPGAGDPPSALRYRYRRT